ncbi:GspH/FimT family pseudopilin [uncultured Shewanella sp.]|uniref:GspH/FimT family pseudopilin n=1 Tax=uncultured Shewanella sp. TaxID=173975 RepID=UPI00262EE3DA|nr:GspH/FimT family pseudopilin [uncultured Shewanella sp.]
MKICAGFTLIELMTTLVVAIILTGIAAPSLTDLNLSYRAKSSVKTIQQTFQLARNQAISYGSRVTACPVQSNRCVRDWNIGITVFIDSGESNVIDGADEIIFATSPFNADDIITYNRLAVRFQPDGLASGTNGTLKYCPLSSDNKYSKAVIINQSGRVRFSTKENIRCDT